MNPPADQLNSLRLGDDDVDLLREVERTFCVSIKPIEASELYNVGQLFDLLKSKLGSTDERRTKCLTAVCFFRLRRAVWMIRGIRINPTTKIFDVVPKQELGQFYESLGYVMAARLPSLSDTGWRLLIWILGISLLLAGFFVEGAVVSRVLVLSGLFALLFASVIYLPRALPYGVATFGDLAERIMTMNYGTLSRETGVKNDNDLWNVLVEVIREIAPFDGQIVASTRLAA